MNINYYNKKFDGNLEMTKEFYMNVEEDRRAFSGASQYVLDNELAKL